MPALKPTEMPFRVVLKGTKAFVNGFEEESHAKASAESANERAEKMGVKARYEVVTFP